ncbi:MAG TPA: Rdx family protein [Terriglobales bacterium]|nr:Rdx family protein [Terriglobales bacterium]
MSLKASLEKEFGVQVPVRAGAPGSLNVILNGERIFSRQDKNQPVSHPEIIQLIRTKSAAS